MPRSDEEAVLKDYVEAIVGGQCQVEFARPPRPDAIVHIAAGSRGVEVTSLIDRAEIEASKQEEHFLENVNQLLTAAQPNFPYRVSLVMQDDRDQIVHQPAEGMDPYPLIAAWLDAIIIEPCPEEVTPKVVLNQKRSGRPCRGLFPPDKHLNRFAEELLTYASALDPHTDFMRITGWPTIHHGVTANMKERRIPNCQPEEVSSLERKLTDLEKYDRAGLECLDLVIHNYRPDDLDMRAVWHPYWHNLPEILSHLAARVASRAPGIFDDVYFLDYSQCHGTKAIAYRIGNGSVVAIPPTV